MCMVKKVCTQLIKCLFTFGTITYGHRLVRRDVNEIYNVFMFAFRLVIAYLFTIICLYHLVQMIKSIRRFADFESYLLWVKISFQS